MDAAVAPENELGSSLVTTTTTKTIPSLWNDFVAYIDHDNDNHDSLPPWMEWLRDTVTMLVLPMVGTLFVVGLLWKLYYSWGISEYFVPPTAADLYWQALVLFQEAKSNDNDSSSSNNNNAAKVAPSIAQSQPTQNRKIKPICSSLWWFKLQTCRAVVWRKGVVVPPPVVVRTRQERQWIEVERLLWRSIQLSRVEVEPLSALPKKNHHNNHNHSKHHRPERTTIMTSTTTNTTGNHDNASSSHYYIHDDCYWSAPVMALAALYLYGWKQPERALYVLDHYLPSVQVPPSIRKTGAMDDHGHHQNNHHDQHQHHDAAAAAAAAAAAPYDSNLRLDALAWQQGLQHMVLSSLGQEEYLSLRTAQVECLRYTTTITASNRRSRGRMTASAPQTYHHDKQQ